jgi:hypothetical protein
MNLPGDFEHAGTRGFYRPVGDTTLEQLIEKAVVAIRTARQMGLIDIVVNTMGLTGFGAPTVLERYSIGIRLVESAGAALRVAIVVRPDFIDPQKLGLLVFQNRGGNGDIFTSEADALAWLDKQLGSRLHKAAPQDGADPA